MKIKCILPLLLCLAFAPAKGAAQNCDCARNFDFLVEKIKANYAGFRNKVTPDKQAGFEEHTARFRRLASAAQSDSACFMALFDWKKWFRDRHIQLRTKISEEETAKIHAQFASRISFKMLDSTTALLVLPTMRETMRKQLDSLLRANKKILKKLPNLIIDCRGNGGGSNVTFKPLTPYLYTNRTYSYRAQFWATQDNIGIFDAARKDKTLPWRVRWQAKQLKRHMLKNQGNYVGRIGEKAEGRGKPKPFPQRVVVLMDGGCASSCENFVRMAGQSTKVTLMGVNTAGISDFSGLHTLELPCKNFQMLYPTMRSTAVLVGKGIDGVGLPPDVRIPADEQDWVEFARQYLKAQAAGK